jgi:GGDEF domain-containing protein
MDSIRLPYALDNGTYNCCISIGVNLFNEPQSDIETVIQQADTAMYVAKQSPDQDYVFY